MTRLDYPDAPPATNGYRPSPLSSLLPEEPLDLGMPDEPEPAEPPAEVAFRTSLRLTDAQEKRLIDYVDKRMAEIMHEMGLLHDFNVRMDSFLGIRLRNQMTYDNDMRWRLLLDGGGGIFRHSNFSLGRSIGYTRYIAARARDDLFGTNPFFAAMAKQAESEKLAKQAEMYVQREIDRSTVRAGLCRAQKNAIIINESVVRISWMEEKTKFTGPATVYVDGAGKPVVTPNGSYIYENDTMLPAPNVELGPDGRPQVLILKKDPSFTMKDGEYKLAPVPELEQTMVKYKGVRSEPIHPTCFLCPLDVKTIHEADLIAHLYKERPLRLQEQYGNKDEVGRRYFANSPMTGDRKPREGQGERDEQRGSVLEQCTVAEVFLTFDANQDGKEEDIWLVLDYDQHREQRALFYDYLPNHFKKRPFECIPGLETVPDRWYGRGIFSLNYDQELHMDAEFNRAQYRGSKASTVLFRQRGACEEWDQNLPVVIGGDEVLTCGPNFDATKNPPIFQVNLATENEKDIQLMEISRQAMDNKVGAISAKDASDSDLNQSKTATGIVNLQAASDVITKATELDQMEAVIAIMEQVVDITLEKMDPVALMLDKDATELITLNREEIRSLPQEIRLTLTKSRSTQAQAIAAQVLVIIKDYRAMMLQDPEGAKLMRSTYIRQLKALEEPDADEVIPEITDEMVQAFRQSQAQGQGQQQPPSKSISAKIGDLAPSERAQLLLSEGIKPADPTELAQQKAEQKAEAAAKAPAPTNGNAQKPAQPARNQ